jgi:hypothetical protein
MQQLTSLFVGRRRQLSPSHSAPCPYPALPPHQRFYNPSEPVASTSALPTQTQEELNAATAQALLVEGSRQLERDERAARELFAKEKREAAEREASDERLAREMLERERVEMESMRREQEDAARALEAKLYDEDLREANGVLGCEVCFGEYYKGELMVQCPEGHLLCVECGFGRSRTLNCDADLVYFVAGAVSGARAAFENLDASLPCLAVGDCGSFYPPDEARKFLDERQWAHVEKLRQDSDVAIFALEGLKSCPYVPGLDVRI